ncbi:MAG TPA: hypothetical protein VFM05_13195 [Candidatus Saccharimonadales bacterium]|nr:hypothetical protein [Candidatus Saccharimonadales bacterium]
MAKFLVEIPMDAYVRCLAKFDEDSAEYLTLRKGVIVRDAPHKAIIHLRCEPDRIQSIMRILAAECPEFLDDIHYYPDPRPAH